MFILNNLEVISSTEEFLVFKTQEQEKGIAVRYENENLWMTQKAMAELFAVNVPAINKHLKNIYDEGELNRDSTISKMEIVQQEGSRSAYRRSNQKIAGRQTEKFEHRRSDFQHAPAGVYRKASVQKDSGKEA